MHDELVALLDAHLRHLSAVRDRLCAPRQVGWGERRMAAAESVAACRRYADAAERVLAGLSPAEEWSPDPVLQRAAR